MQLAEPHFPHARLRIAMAKAHIALDDTAAARGLLQQVLAGEPAQPERMDATRLLQGLPS